MASIHSLIVVIFLCSWSNEITAAVSCEDDWDAYKDEKCLKIFDTLGLVAYEDAENYCKVDQDAHLITIGTEEDQTFIESYLTYKEVVDNVWIGLIYENNEYRWVDGTPLHYTKWKPGDPKNHSDRCVEMLAEEDSFGYWSDVVCKKKNLIICEKIQLWSTVDLQNAVMNLETAVVNLMKNQVPIGFIYVQLPKEKPPTEIWSSGGWKDVSSDYAGVFFRVLGGDSAGFGEVQPYNSARLTHIRREAINDNGAYPEIDIVPGQESVPLDADVSLRSDRAVYFTMSGNETRPVNMAVRVWKKIS